MKPTKRPDDEAEPSTIDSVEQEIDPGWRFALESRKSHCLQQMAQAEQPLELRLAMFAFLQGIFDVRQVALPTGDEESQGINLALDDIQIRGEWTNSYSQAYVQEILNAWESLHNAYQSIMKKMREIEAFREASETDSLTKLPNRRALVNDLNAVFADPAKRDRANGRLTAFCLDLDLFKKINDLLGYSIGDLALQLAAKALQELGKGKAYRYGGEEFVVILELEEAQALTPITQALMDCLSNAITDQHAHQFKRPEQDEPWQLSASVGVVQLGPEVVSTEHWIQFATLLEGLAKRTGRNQACILRDPARASGLADLAGQRTAHTNQERRQRQVELNAKAPYLEWAEPTAGWRPQSSLKPGMEAETKVDANRLQDFENLLLKLFEGWALRQGVLFRPQTEAVLGLLRKGGIGEYIAEYHAGKTTVGGSSPTGSQGRNPYTGDGPTTEAIHLWSPEQLLGHLRNFIHLATHEIAGETLIPHAIIEACFEAHDDRWRSEQDITQQALWLLSKLADSSVDKGR